MGKPLGDDLRRKLLFAYDQGEGTLEELAGRFLVSVGWAKKISAARNRTGQAERVYPSEQPHSFVCFLAVLKLNHECSRGSRRVSQAELGGGISARG